MPQGLEAIDRYSICLYFTGYTLVGLGYGDVTPATTAERYFNVIVMLIGSYLFAFIFGSITSLIAAASAAGEEFHQTMAQLSDFTQVRSNLFLVVLG